MVSITFAANNPQILRFNGIKISDKKTLIPGPIEEEE